MGPFLVRWLTLPVVSFALGAWLASHLTRADTVAPPECGDPVETQAEEIRV